MYSLPQSRHATLSFRFIDGITRKNLRINEIFKMSSIFRSKELNSQKNERWQQIFSPIVFNMKKIKLDVTVYNQAEIKILLFNHGVFKVFVINQLESSIPSQVNFEVLTYKNEVFRHFKIILNRNKTNFMKFPNYSNLSNFFLLIFFVMIILSGLYYIFNSQFKFWNFVQNFFSCSILSSKKKMLPKYKFYDFLFCIF